MAHLSEHLVGRAEELGAFDQLLVDLESGEPAAIALAGEPGIGKTRLLAELETRADERGHLVLAGSASELERDLPFWVFVDAIEEYVQALDPQRPRARSTTTCGQSSRGCSRHWPGSRPVARRGSRTSGTEATGRFGSCSPGSRRRARSC